MNCDSFECGGSIAEDALRQAQGRQIGSLAGRLSRPSTWLGTLSK